MEYPPFVAGGAGVYAECLCRELARLGNEIHVVAPRIGPFRDEHSNEGVLVHRVPVISRALWWVPSYWLNLRGYFKELQKSLQGFDIVHGNVNSDLTLTKKLVNSPRVATIHHLGRTTFTILHPSLIEVLNNPGGELGLFSWIEKNTLDFDKVVASRVDRLITVSNFCKHELITRYGIQPSKISVIPNGVYPENYQFLDHEIGLLRQRFSDSDEFLVLYVGRLERRKGLALLLKAFKLVLKKEKARLIVVGSGKQDSYRQLASSLNIGSNVVFVGYLGDLTLRKMYCACDLFVSSSYLEGFGMTLLEAMASAKPVVALNVGGISDVVKDNVNGKLVTNIDYHELADAILYFARDRNQSKKIGMQNRRYVVANFSWRKCASLTEELYNILA
jgi:glycosyltransferase involved in cell wall biosynthesis